MPNPQAAAPVPCAEHAGPESSPVPDPAAPVKQVEVVDGGKKQLQIQQVTSSLQRLNTADIQA